MDTFDIVIVGNGILAYSTAFELLHKEAGLKLAIIGPQDRHYAATSAAGAMLGCFGEVSEKTLSSTYHKTKFELCLKALKRWPSWLEKINACDGSLPPVQTKSGTFVIRNTTGGELDDKNFDAIKDVLTIYRQPFERVNPNHIPGYNPNVHSRATDSFYIPEEGFIAPDTLLTKLHSVLATQFNVTFIDDEVEHVITEANKATGVVLKNNQQVYANKVLLAAGSMTQKLLDATAIADAIPRLFSGIGMALLLETPQSMIRHVIRTPNRSFACGLHALPREKHLYIGATNNLGMRPEKNPRLGLVNFLSQCAIDQVDRQLNQAKVAGYEVGNRPVSLDTFPLLGQTSIQGLFVSSGSYRDGLHCAPIFADIISDEMLGKTPTIKHPFPVMRKPLNLYTKQQAIDEGVKHYLSGAYEHKMTLPNVGWYDMFRDMLYDKISKLYNELDSDFIIPPDFLLIFDEASEQDIAEFRTYLQSVRLQQPHLAVA